MCSCARSRGERGGGVQVLGYVGGRRAGRAAWPLVDASQLAVSRSDPELSDPQRTGREGKCRWTAEIKANLPACALNCAMDRGKVFVIRSFVDINCDQSCVFLIKLSRKTSRRVTSWHTCF